MARFTVRLGLALAGSAVAASEQDNNLRSNQQTPVIPNFEGGESPRELQEEKCNCFDYNVETEGLNIALLNYWPDSFWGLDHVIQGFTLPSGASPIRAYSIQEMHDFKLIYLGNSIDEERDCVDVELPNLALTNCPTCYGGSDSPASEAVCPDGKFITHQNFGVGDDRGAILPSVKCCGPRGVTHRDTEGTSTCAWQPIATNVVRCPEREAIAGIRWDSEEVGAYPAGGDPDEVYCCQMECSCTDFHGL